MSKKTTWTEEDILKLLQIQRMMDVASLNFVIENPDGDNDKCAELGDFIEDPSPSPQELLEDKDTKEQLIKYVSKLPPREMMVITLRYGLEDGKVKTLDEVGKIFGITRERVRQVEAKAIKKLQHLIIDKAHCHTINDF